MTEDLRVAVVGATGVLGAELLTVLFERGYSFGELSLFASSDSAGELYLFGDQEIEIAELQSPESLSTFDCVFLCTPPEVSLKLEGALNADQQIVIDLVGSGLKSSIARTLVPDADLTQTVEPRSGFFANPNPIVCQLAPVLTKVNQAAGIRAIVASTYQSVSEAGKLALDELWDQTRSVFTQSAASQEAFHHQIAFNCVPQVDNFLEDGSTRAESKIESELRALLELPELPVSITCVRVPVFHSHSVSIHIELSEALSTIAFEELMAPLAFVQCAVHPEEFPMPLSVTTNDEIFIGRVRARSGKTPALSLWIVADNLRRGAAINAIQIFESCTRSLPH